MNIAVLVRPTRFSLVHIVCNKICAIIYTCNVFIDKTYVTGTSSGIRNLLTLCD